MKISVFIAASLDGFIARPDGSLDWLIGSGEEPDVGSDEVAAADDGEGADDHGWDAFWESVDCLLLGRKTFEKVLRHEVWPYEGTRVIVLSGTMTAVPDKLHGQVEIGAGDPVELVEKLASEGHEHLYVDGGQTIQSFLRRGLITDMTITTVPVLIGEGIPLFGALPEDIHLRHIKTEAYSGGSVQSTYEI